MEGVVEEEDDRPVKDIDDAIETELDKLQYSRRLRNTATRKKLTSVEHPRQRTAKMMHTEL